MKAFLSIDGGKPIPCEVVGPIKLSDDDGKRVRVPKPHTETFEMKVKPADLQGLFLHINGATNPHDSQKIIRFFFFFLFTSRKSFRILFG